MKGSSNSRFNREVSQTAQPCPDGGNCCITAHMNTPKSALSLVCKVHYSDNQRNKISIARPHGNRNCRSDCMESGVSDNLSHVKSAFHHQPERCTWMLLDG